MSDRPLKKSRISTTIGSGPGHRSKSSKRDSKSHKPTLTGFSRIQKYTNLPLPDGTHRRKLEKIKASLIQRAKAVQHLRKTKSQNAEELEAGKRRFEELARLAEEEKEAERRRRSRSRDDEEERGGDGEWNGIQDGDDGGNEDGGMHPDRIARGKEEDEKEKNEEKERKNRHEVVRGEREEGSDRRKQKRPSRFGREVSEAVRVAAEREAHKKMFEEREAEKRRREQERERWHKAVNAKTRTGQVKLGKQSGLLLEKIKRQMGESR